MLPSCSSRCWATARIYSLKVVRCLDHACPTLPLETPSPGTRQPSAEAIRFEDVSLAFDDKQILNNISFRLAHGETKALFGVAGSGKSTILKLALGLMKPDSGKIYVLGEEVTQMSEKDLFNLRDELEWCFRRALCSIHSR